MHTDQDHIVLTRMLTIFFSNNNKYLSNGWPPANDRGDLANSTADILEAAMFEFTSTDIRQSTVSWPRN